MSHGRFSALSERMDAKASILEALQGITSEQHGDGFIDIPLVRSRLPQISRPALDRYLLELERARLLHLRVAQNPHTLRREGHDPAEGIDVPSRGLLYYIQFEG